MSDFDRILAIKEVAETRLLALPGVHAVGIGKKIVDGRPTDELCITVFLIQKKPLDQLSPNEVIPPEIDGIKTDVVQMEMPRLTMAANPADLVATISANQLSVTFSGKAGDGLIVVLYFTITPTGSAPGTPSNTPVTIAGWFSLSAVASAVATALNARGATGMTAAAAGAQVTITPGAGSTAALVRCTVIAADDHRYFEDHVRGGIQIQLGGVTGNGTIGCLATASPTAQYPKGRVVALTCQHVVVPPAAEPTNLTAVVAGNQITFAKTGTQPIKFDSLVRVSMTNTRQNAFYNTVAGETPASVATAITTAINTLAGVSATRVGAVVTVVGDIPACNTQGPPVLDPESDLNASVVGTAIDFTGDVSGDDYGIFVNVNTGGTLATFGVHVNPAEDSKLSDIAEFVADAITALPAPRVRGTVTAASSAARVNISNAQEVECIIKSDRQVGQPDNDFGSPCSHCCSHRIGRLLDARIDIDTAIIQLDAGQKYKPMIEDFGFLSGTLALNPSHLQSLLVFKRGRTTGQTGGIVQNLNVSGEVALPGAFHRHYTNAHILSSAQSNNEPFGLPGDSGSAVYTLGGEVVGLLFGAIDVWGWITPIEQITAAYLALNLDFAPAPEPGHAPADVRVVPAAAMVDASAMNVPAVRPAPFIEKLLVQAEKEITAIPAGFEYAQVVKRHFFETQRLVNSNRRVATVWHRNGGPQILQAVLHVLQRRDQRLPEEINGKPLVECLEQIKRVLARYASPSLAADLSRFTPRLARFSGLTYPQMLSALQSGRE